MKGPYRRVSRLLILGTVLPTAGCETPPPTEYSGIPVDTYVTVVAELADISRFPPPGRTAEEREAAADSLRRVILDRHDVTPDRLMAFAEQAGNRPAVMAEIMGRVSAVTDSLAAERAEGRRSTVPAAEEGLGEDPYDVRGADAARTQEDSASNQGPADGLARFRGDLLRRHREAREADTVIDE